MLMYQVFVPGVPRPQPRPKAALRGRRVHIYTPTTAAAWKLAIANTLKVAHENAGSPPPMEGPVSVVLQFFFPRPASTLRKDGTLRPGSPRHHTQRPDLDNLGKAALDAISDSGVVWQDDDQVDWLVMRKHWVWVGLPQAEGVEIHIQPTNAPPSLVPSE